MILDSESVNYLAACLCEALSERGIKNVTFKTMHEVINEFIEADTAASEDWYVHEKR